MEQLRSVSLDLTARPRPPASSIMRVVSWPCSITSRPVLTMNQKATAPANGLMHAYNRLAISFRLGPEGASSRT
jgi:hypothetical protein